MSVDKFGRHSRRLSVIKGPKGEGFDFTPEGDFDIKSRRLCNVKEPKEKSDAVNLEYLRDKCLHHGLSNEQILFIDAKQTIIRHVREPEVNSDAATKAYVDYNTPASNNFLWDFRHRRLTNCSNPTDDGDAVTLRYFQYWTPKINTEENAWKFINYRLVDIGTPLDSGDAVNLKYLCDNALVKKNLVSGFDAKNCTISNVGLPKDIDDVISKKYLRHALLKFGMSLFQVIMADNTLSPDQTVFFNSNLARLVSEWFDK